MKKRCDSTSAWSSKYYSGRGITYCPSWGRFENFLADMGECPDGLELDRIDNDKGYFKENCRWVTHKENCNNRGAYGRFA